MEQVDIGRYLGRWYQIAHKPLFFEAGCTCSVQDLSAQASSELVAVRNSCHQDSPAGALRQISGTATNDDPASNSKFTVDFGLPSKGQYWIIGLDPSYRFAVVSDPSKKSLYILSKEPTLDKGLYDEAVAIAAKQVDVSDLEITLQSGCTYP